MGKKDKSKKKISGNEKTALKTEKKLNAKRKKELSAIGEDDIEKIVEQIEKEESRRQKVVEAVVAQPSRRVNFTLTPHPFKDELIMLGGEFHDGQKTVVYGDMFYYNLSKKEWTIVKAPGGPPPRCGHQAVAIPSNNGELWVFGGEFSSPSESQFYHYRDLWVYKLSNKKWEKIIVSGGPSARSGHRMVYLKKQLFIFGGFHDNLRDYKYFNDVYSFNLSSYTWTKIETSGIPPHPRSGCIVLPTSDNKILIYGGYCKEKVKKDVDKGQVHTDMYLLSPLKNDESGLKWKWTLVKQSGTRPSPRCSASGILVQPDLAYIFGGVFDEEDNEEDIQGTFYNDLIALNLSKFHWYNVMLSGKNENAMSRRRRKIDNSDIEENRNQDENEYEHKEPMETTTFTDDDGIFTVTVGPAPSVSSNLKESAVEKDIFHPSPRINPGLAMKHNTLYLYGGLFEDGKKQYTLNDFYSLDCRKLDEWNTIIKDDLSSQVWLDSSCSESEDTNDSTSEDSDDDKMEVET